MLTGELLVDGGVELCDLDVGALEVVLLSEVGVGGSHLLAVAAPGGVELDEDDVVLGDELGGVGVLQDEDRLLGLGGLEFVEGGDAQ